MSGAEKSATIRLCGMMTGLITLRHPTADVTVRVERNPDVSEDSCAVTGDADDPVKIEEDLRLDGDEFTDSAFLGRFHTKAEILRLLDEASTEQLSSLGREDVIRALRLDVENLRLRTLKTLFDSGVVRP